MDEAEFWTALKRLSALHGKWQAWEMPEANKEHEDAFGVTIKRGETYFRKQTGPGFASVVKLSRSSMEKLLYVFVATSPQVEAIADVLIQEQAAQLRAAADRISRPHRRTSAKK